jgi:D-threo-aldose 1-dehydrogenase
MSAEPRRIVGRGVALPRLGLGTAPLGWLFREISEEDAVATVRAALDGGIRLIDTAAGYGLGTAEQRVGLALDGEAPDDLVISTKAGRLMRPAPPGTPPRFPGAPALEPVVAWGRGEIRRSLEESLERLGRDRVDVLYLHDPDDAEGELRDHAIAEAIALREEGVVGAVGVGMNQCEMPARLVRDDLGLDVLLIAGRYSLLTFAAADELLPLCAERGVAVVLGGVLATGVLADPGPGARFEYREAPSEIVERAHTIRRICAGHGVDPLAAAMQFPFAQPAVASVVVGMRSPTEAAANARAFAEPVPPELWAALRMAGVLPERIVTPDQTA